MSTPRPPCTVQISRADDQRSRADSAGLIHGIANDPAPQPLIVELIPAELRDRRQWVTWRYTTRGGKRTKVPHQTNGEKAAADAPHTWTTFDLALAGYERGTFDGVGYVFAADDPYFGVDIDNVKRDPERLVWALEIVQRFGSYAEWSPSGNGIHIIGRGKLPGGGRNDQKLGLEVYDRGRFFTVTGHLVEVRP